MPERPQLSVVAAAQPVRGKVTVWALQALATALAAVPGVFELSRHGLPDWLENQPVRIALIIHALGIFVLLCAATPLPKMDPSKEYEPAIVASRRFVSTWYIAWTALFFFYAGRAASRVFLEGTADTGWVWVAHPAIDMLYMISAGLTLVCYLIMALEDDFAWFPTLFWVFGGPLALLVAEAIIGAQVGEDAHFWFDTFYGLFAGTALALFVGRLESKLIGTSLPVVVLLYAYAILQLGYPFVSEPDLKYAPQLLWFTSIDLLLQILLFWHVRTLIVNRSLTCYMLQFRHMSQTLADEKEHAIAALRPKEETTRLQIRA